MFTTKKYFVFMDIADWNKIRFTHIKKNPRNS